MTLSKNIKIAILDFSVEKNRGDAALQVGLLKLVYNFFDAPQISVISVIGSNQTEYLADAHDHSFQWPITFLGGIKPTFYPFGGNKMGVLAMEVLNAFSLLANLFHLMLAFAGVPVKFLSKLYSPDSRKSLYAIHDADLVLWNRRNVRSRRFHLLEIYRTLNIVFHPLMALAFGKPMAVAGSSLWELNSPISRNIARFVFERFFFTSFREENSYLIGRKLLPHKDPERIRLLPDLSFAVFDKLDNLLKARRQLSQSPVPQKIGITLVDWTGNGQDARMVYVESIVETIRYFAERGSRFVIVPQVTKRWEGFDGVLKDVQEKLSPQESVALEVIEGEPGVDDLLEIYSQLDFLIATRMHSAIFALAVQTPVAVISYDTGGKWGILSELGYASHIIPYAEVTAPRLIGKVAEIWMDRDAILEFAGRKVAENIRNVDLNVSLMAGYFENDCEGKR